MNVCTLRHRDKVRLEKCGFPPFNISCLYLLQQFWYQLILSLRERAFRSRYTRYQIKYSMAASWASIEAHLFEYERVWDSLLLPWRNGCWEHWRIGNRYLWGLRVPRHLGTLWWNGESEFNIYLLQFWLRVFKSLGTVPMMFDKCSLFIVIFHHICVSVGIILCLLQSFQGVVNLKTCNLLRHRFYRNSTLSTKSRLCWNFNFKMDSGIVLEYI